MRTLIFSCLFYFTFSNAGAQLVYPKEQIYSPVTIANDAAEKRRADVIKKADNLNMLPIGRDDEASFNLDIGLWGISQFRVRTPQSDSGIARLIKNYDQLSEGTQRALLEATYALYPNNFIIEMKGIANRASHPRNFAMAALHVYRAEFTDDTRQWIRQKIKQLRGNEKQQILLQTLSKYISEINNQPLPSFDSLFAHQQLHGFKMIYSFQRANRDYPGLAIVQKKTEVLPEIALVN